MANLQIEEKQLALKGSERFVEIRLYKELSRYSWNLAYFTLLRVEYLQCMRVEILAEI